MGMSRHASARAVLASGLVVASFGLLDPFASAQGADASCGAALASLPVEETVLPAGYEWESLHVGWSGSIVAGDAPADEAKTLTITIACDPDADRTFQRAADVRAALGLEDLLATRPIGEESVGLRWTDGPFTGIRIEWREGPLVGTVANRYPTARGESVPITDLEAVASSLDALFQAALYGPPSASPNPSAPAQSPAPSLSVPSPAPTPSASPSPTAPTGSPGVSARVIDLELDPALQILHDGRQVRAIPVTPGETIEFRLTNSAGYVHGFWIGTDDQLRTGQVDGLPGVSEWSDPKVRTLTWVVPDDVSGLHFGCTVPGHYPLMRGRFKLASEAAAVSPQTRLTISESQIRLDQLPAALDLKVEVKDAKGHVFTGSPVTFSVSAPGLPTLVLETVLVDGVARMADVPIPLEGATRGNGFVTVRVDLGPAVGEVAATKPFVIR